MTSHSMFHKVSNLTAPRRPVASDSQKDRKRILNTAHMMISINAKSMVYFMENPMKVDDDRDISGNHHIYIYIDGISPH